MRLFYDKDHVLGHVPELPDPRADLYVGDKTASECGESRY